MAGAVGIEPTNHGIKTRCLTAWLRPKIYKTFNPVVTLFASPLSTFIKKTVSNYFIKTFTSLILYAEIIY